MTRKSNIQIDDKRKQIVECKKHLLVLGGPGSGKTTIALYKAFVHLERNSLKRGQKILFLSFSRNARSRIEESIQSFHEFKHLWSQLEVQTFHSFFLNLLKTHGYLVGVKSPVQIILPHQANAINTSIEGESERNNHYIKLMRAEGKITFDSFSPLVKKMVESSSKIRSIISNSHPSIFIDEAQDTDSLQWGILKSLHKNSQLIFLGDLDQQIFDYRHDVTPERIINIRDELSPLEIDLTLDNYRNPDNDIRECALDVLNGKGFKGSYKSVEIIKYRPQMEFRNRGIVTSVGRMFQELKKQNIVNPSVAILCSRNKAAIILSQCLAKSNIPHQLAFDETPTIYSGLLIACLLEPVFDINQHLVWVFIIFRDYHLSKNQKSQAQKYDAWINQTVDDKLRATKITKFWNSLLLELSNHKYTGDIKKDWVFIRDKLIGCNVSTIKDFAINSKLLFAFHAGRRLSELLSNEWMNNGVYSRAREYYQQALTEAQLERRREKLSGIHIMTTYKAKGKEFDGVIIYQNNYHSPIDLNQKDGKLMHARKVIFVAMTRAKNHVYLLMQQGSENIVLLPK